jgi:TonB family protein
MISWRNHFLIITILVFSFIQTRSQELIPAQPRGGERLAREFINEEIVYPAKALSESVEGIVTFNFIVQEQGLVKELQITEPVDPLLRQEAVRIFRMILWQPAQYRGKAMESVVTFKIPFSVKKYRKVCRQRGYDSFIKPDGVIDSSLTVYQYKYTDSPPEPAFGSKEMDMSDFMAENFNYPDAALRKNISGTVKLNFIVEPHGRISNLMVLETLGAGCTEEAIRLVKLLRWKPGSVNGKIVRVNLTIPITFGLSSDGRYKVTPATGGTTFQ